MRLGLPGQCGKKEEQMAMRGHFLRGPGALGEERQIRRNLHSRHLGCWLHNPHL